MDVQLAYHAALAERASIQADLRDPVHHQHGRFRQLGIAGAEIAAFARLKQVFLGVGGLRCVEIMGSGHLRSCFVR